MYVALRDLRFARGRFVLIGAVVVLITVLVGFLSGLTGGLAQRNVSAVLDLPADRLVFAAPAAGEDVSFADSALTQDQMDSWAAVDGVIAVEPVGISQTRVESDRARTAVAVFGVRPQFDPQTPTGRGQVVLSEPAARELAVEVGGDVRIAGSSYRVTAIGGDSWYSHVPVVRMELADWQALSTHDGTAATVLAVRGDTDWAAADAATGTSSSTLLGSLTGLSSFRSEIGSLLLMIALLFGISGLVVGAFFTVWSLQRSADVAVLKALGASTASLVRAALGQALLVLLLGVGTGLGVVVLLGSLAGTALPFLLSPLTTVLPGALMIALGLAGAAFALRSVTATDPLTALGSAR